MLAATASSPCADGVDEMIIVDTGSTDRTIEIAESYGATVAALPWTGRFSEARNHGLEPATGNYILWLDADERLEDGDAARLRELAAPAVARGALARRDELHRPGGGRHGRHAPRAAALAQPPALPLLGRDPRADPHLDADGPARALRRLDAADPPLRLPQGAHRGARQARAQPRAAAGRARAQPARRRSPTSTSAPSTSAWATCRAAAAPLRAGAHARLRASPPGGRSATRSLLGSRLVRRAPRDAATSTGADALATELLGHFPGFTDLVFERALLRPRPRRPRPRAEELFERCLEMGDAPAALLRHGRPRLVPGARPRWPSSPTSRRPRGGRRLARARARASTRATWPPASSSPSMLLAADDADPDAVLARLRGLRATTSSPGGCSSAPRSTSAATPRTAERLFRRRCLAKGDQHPAARVGLVEALLTQHRYADVEAEARRARRRHAGVPRDPAPAACWRRRSPATRRPPTRRARRSSRRGGGDPTSSPTLRGLSRGARRPRRRARCRRRPCPALLRAAATRSRGSRSSTRSSRPCRSSRPPSAIPRGRGRARRALPGPRLLPLAGDAGAAGDRARRAGRAHAGAARQERRRRGPVRGRPAHARGVRSSSTRPRSPSRSSSSRSDRGSPRSGSSPKRRKTRRSLRHPAE